MLEIIKIKRDIQWLYNNVRCLLNKSNVETPLSATEWSYNHSVGTGNPYTIDTLVWYEGNIYKCLAENNGLPVTYTEYWENLGPGFKLAEEQSDWNVSTGRPFIKNKPTTTSDFTNDGEDGTSPFVTQEELAEAIPDSQNLDEVLAEGDEAPTRTPKVKEIGLWDTFVAPFDYATLSVNKSNLYFKNKVGAYVASIGSLGIQFYKGIYNFNISIPTLTANRTASFQDKTGVVAYLSDISEATSTEVVYEIEGGTSGTQPTFTGDPLFSGSYVKIGNLVHFQIQVDMDNITNFGTGQYYVDLPFNAKYGYQFKEGCLHDFSSGKQYAIGGHVALGANRLYLTYTASNGQDESFTHSSPITLNVADNFHIAGTYIVNS